jgi:CDP-diglyceride synthetase
VTRSRAGTVLAVVGGGATAVLAAAWLALVEVFWLPLRVAGLLVPVSVVAAVVGNLLLVGLALRLTGSRVAAALPALTWGAVVIAAMIRRPEGDLVLTGQGALGTVNLAFLLLGLTAAAFAVGRALGSRPGRPAVSPGSPADPAPHPAGSGSGGAR